MKLASGLLLAFLAWGLSPALAATVPFNQNLIINGDAESDVGSSDGSSIGAVTGFTRTGEFTVTKYKAVVTLNDFPAIGSPGPADRGLNFFSGGFTNPSIGHQRIDITGVAFVHRFGFYKI